MSLPQRASKQRKGEAETRMAKRQSETYVGGDGARGGDGCMTLGTHCDAMTYRPRSPRALTSRSRSKSDREHVNSTPAITRSRPDQATLIGQAPASPFSRLAAPALAA